MIEQTLTVASINDTTAYLEAEKKQACEGCNGRCGSQVFSKLFGTAKKTFPYKFDAPLEIGQKVTLALDDSHVVKHAFAVYMLPLLFSLGFALITAGVFSLPELWQIIAAIMGGFVGYMLAKTRVKSIQHEIKIIKIHPISIPLTQIDGD
ncbi:SoxR reducing system RseC family protein [Pseudoalteromonas sp.]|uniref:SoxR reducing system RseC family protein n=1 Tax=Pseudoalteromonas sp. TaxID=53249 RepID=UPI003F984DF5